jgi:dihydrofolate reductase
MAGRQPWRIPEDLRRFHDLTAGVIVILGRSTFEGWPRAALDGRRPIVITRGTQPEKKDVRTAPSFEAALAIAESLPGEIFVTGGERVFEAALALSRPLRLYLTLIHAKFPGDRTFPDWGRRTWTQLARTEGSDGQLRFTFLTLEL